MQKQWMFWLWAPIGCAALSPLGAAALDPNTDLDELWELAEKGTSAGVPADYVSVWKSTVIGTTIAAEAIKAGASAILEWDSQASSGSHYILPHTVRNLLQRRMGQWENNHDRWSQNSMARYYRDTSHLIHMEVTQSKESGSHIGATVKLYEAELAGTVTLSLSKGLLPKSSQGAGKQADDPEEASPAAANPKAEKRKKTQKQRQKHKGASRFQAEEDEPEEKEPDAEAEKPSAKKGSSRVIADASPEPPSAAEAVAERKGDIRDPETLWRIAEEVATQAGTDIPSKQIPIFLVTSTRSKFMTGQYQAAAKESKLAVKALCSKRPPYPMKKDEKGIWQIQEEKIATEYPFVADVKAMLQAAGIDSVHILIFGPLYGEKAYTLQLIQAHFPRTADRFSFLLTWEADLLPVVESEVAALDLYAMNSSYVYLRQLANTMGTNPKTLSPNQRNVYRELSKKVRNSELQADHWFYIQGLSNTVDSALQRELEEVVSDQTLKEQVARELIPTNLVHFFAEKDKYHQEIMTGDFSKGRCCRALIKAVQTSLENRGINQGVVNLFFPFPLHAAVRQPAGTADQQATTRAENKKHWKQFAQKMAEVVEPLEQQVASTAESQSPLQVRLFLLAGGFFEPIRETGVKPIARV